MGPKNSQAVNMVSAAVMIAAAMAVLGSFFVFIIY
jgi:hypothetical protein